MTKLGMCIMCWVHKCRKADSPCIVPEELRGKMHCDCHTPKTKDMKYFAIDRSNGSKTELTREEFINRVSRDRDISGIIELMETGGGINHSNRYQTDFFIYEVIKL